MRQEKQTISAEYLARLNSSPFVYLVDYQGLNNLQFGELRKRLSKAGAEIHVIKNSIFGIASKEAGLGDVRATMKGQMAAVTGGKDLTNAAKTLKTFNKEFNRGQVKGGFLGSKRLTAQEVGDLADLPSMDVLRGTLLGLFQAPASRLARLIATPGAQIARAIQARVDKESE